MDAGQLAAQVLGDAPLVGGVEIGEEQADGDRLGAGLAQRRAPAAPAPRRPSGSITPSGPIRSAASKRSSGSTSGAGFGAQRR